MICMSCSPGLVRIGLRAMRLILGTYRLISRWKAVLLNDMLVLVVLPWAVRSSALAGVLSEVVSWPQWVRMAFWDTGVVRLHLRQLLRVWKLRIPWLCYEYVVKVEDIRISANCIISTVGSRTKWRSRFTATIIQLQ